MEQKQQIADRLSKSNNILVTVSNNPSVDQLASCIGLTLALNKMGKHATAVFSGTVPSTIEFLQPEKTIEPNTDSLRDFIISLDKTKADKLRYKVEDKVVKIFITPYRTSISEKDLEFGQGDFNVDVVIALGVHNQADLDQAITSHGRILHDATVATVNIKPGGELGSINWVATSASSLSELAVELVDTIDKQLIDGQIATAFLTGIVAETERFRNEKTSPVTMSISAELMAAGANQQLIATKLEKPAPEPVPIPAPAPEQQPQEHSKVSAAPKSEQGGRLPAQPVAAKPDDGTLEISHENKPLAGTSDSKPEVEINTDETNEATEKEPATPQIQIDEQGQLRNIEDIKEDKGGSTDPMQHVGGSHMILQPPTLGAPMSASGMPEENFSDPLSLPQPADPSSVAGPQPSSVPSSFMNTPASANISAPDMPFMPPSMTPPSARPSQPAPESPVAPAPVVGPTPFAMPPAAPAPEQSADAAVPPDLVPAPVAEPSPQPDESHLDNARNAVMQAIAAQPQSAPPEPIHALNAHPLGDVLHSQPQVNATPPDLNIPVPAEAPVAVNPAGLSMPAPVGAPPPVPPPMTMPPQQ